MEFTQSAQTLYNIEFERYDDQVHKSTDTIFVISRNQLPSAKILNEFVKTKPNMVISPIVGTENQAESWYTVVDRTYKITVTMLPEYANHFVMEIK